jgi:hypothetical protein
MLKKAKSGQDMGFVSIKSVVTSNKRRLHKKSSFEVEGLKKTAHLEKNAHFEILPMYL